MTRTTPLANASSATIKTSEKVVISRPGTTAETTSSTRCEFYYFEHFTAPDPKAPDKHTTIGDLISRWEKDEGRRSGLEEARRWAADTLYGEDGDTVRTLRLRKGWSQARLAKELSTSQSHVARIERGTENLTIETCRKLATVLGIDLNTLDQALKRQENIARSKAKRND